MRKKIKGNMYTLITGGTKEQLEKAKEFHRYYWNTVKIVEIGKKYGLYGWGKFTDSELKAARKRR